MALGIGQDVAEAGVAKAVEGDGFIALGDQYAVGGVPSEASADQGDYQEEERCGMVSVRYQYGISIIMS